MKRNDRRAGLAVILLASVIAIIVALSLGMRTRAQGAGGSPSHLPTDWSHRHLVFSRPDSFWRAWELQQEPRFWHQWARQNEWALRAAALATERQHRDHDGDRDDDDDSNGGGIRPNPNPIRRDWAVSLGSLGTVGPGMFPAKFSFDVNASPSCTADYVAFTTSLPGSSSVPSIVAFDNLYSTQPAGGGFCSLAGPTVKWAYNTNAAGDTTGATVTSPVLSFDGTKIAFAESNTNANGGSVLHILKWKPGAAIAVQGTIAAPATPDTILAAGQSWSANCPAANSCVANITFNGAQADTGSAPFYDYTNDAIYVGDDNGVLHKFTGVFGGTPTEVGAAGGWPITVHSAAVLTGPVLDPASRNIFVADHTGRLSFVKETGSSTGSCASGSPPCLGSVNQPLTGSIVDPPIVDTSTQRVLVFDGTETSGNDGSAFQFNTALTAASRVTVRIGGNQGAAPTAADIVHAGTFDDAYFSSGPGSGHFYTCGKDPGFNNRPAVYQLHFNASGVLQTTGNPAPLRNLTTTFSLIGDACSPVTELKNGATDRIFFAFATNAQPPPAPGTATGCTAGQGCLASIVLGGAWPPAATTAGIAVPFILTAPQTGSGGTSGIVVDNVGTGTQESSIYYSYQTNSTAAVQCNGTTGVGCAVKVTQSALQ